MLLVPLAAWRKSFPLNTLLFRIKWYVPRVASAALLFSIGLSLSCLCNVMSFLSTTMLVLA